MHSCSQLSKNIANKHRFTHSVMEESGDFGSQAFGPSLNSEDEKMIQTEIENLKVKYK